MGEGLSIIIVSYNDYRALYGCIESILRYNDIGSRLEIVIIDNSTANGVLNIDQYRQYISIVYHHMNNNVGFGRANNFGVTLSHFDNLCFLNQDTRVVEPVFAYAVRLLSAGNVDMLGFKLVDDLGKPVQSFGTMPQSWNLLNLFILTDTVRTFLGIHAPNFYIQGADIFIRKQVFNAIGGFDENIFLFGEEIDLTTRFDKENYKKEFIKSKTIIHSSGEERTVKQRQERTRQLSRSLDYLYEKYKFRNYRRWILANRVKYLLTRNIEYEMLSKSPNI